MNLESAQSRVFGALFTQDLRTIKTFPDDYPGIRKENMELIVKLMKRIKEVKGINQVINMESRNYVGFVGDNVLFLFASPNSDYQEISRIVDEVRVGFS